MKASIIYKKQIASPMTWKYFWGEVVELLIEVKNGNLNGIREEWSDVWYHFWLAVYSNWKIDMPMLFAGYTIKKVEARLKIWEKIFEKNGLRFDKKYLDGGSNYKKPEKVQLALKKAIQETIKMGEKS